MKLFSTQALVERAGVSLPTLHKYIRQGIVIKRPPPGFAANPKVPFWTEADIRHVRALKRERVRLVGQYQRPRRNILFSIEAKHFEKLQAFAAAQKVSLPRFVARIVRKELRRRS